MLGVVGCARVRACVLGCLYASWSLLRRPLQILPVWGRLIQTGVRALRLSPVTCHDRVIPDTHSGDIVGRSGEGGAGGGGDGAAGEWPAGRQDAGAITARHHSASLAEASQSSLVRARELLLTRHIFLVARGGGVVHRGATFGFLFFSIEMPEYLRAHVCSPVNAHLWISSASSV